MPITPPRPASLFQAMKETGAQPCFWMKSTSARLSWSLLAFTRKRKRFPCSVSVGPVGTVRMSGTP